MLNKINTVILEDNQGIANEYDAVIKKITNHKDRTHHYGFSNILKYQIDTIFVANGFIDSIDAHCHLNHATIQKLKILFEIVFKKGIHQE